MRDPIPYLRRLVAIPSDADTVLPEGPVEAGLTAALRGIIATDLPGWEIRSFLVGKGRENILVSKPGDRIRLLFIGHMDVVRDGTGWTRPVRGEAVGDRFYGRGSTDMKGGIASILSALGHAEATGATGVGALFYCDEEYSFAGMKTFLAAAPADLRPDLVVCPEPTQEKLRAGCRGILELRVTIHGRRGHAARPQTGVNAFDAFSSSIAALRSTLSSMNDPELGKPTLCVSSVQCGVGKDGRVESFDIGNVIPDTCRALIDIRTVPGITIEEVTRVLTDAAVAVGASLHVEAELRLGSFRTDRSSLTIVEAAQRETLGSVTYEDPGEGGYSDAQMLAEAWSVPAVIWGPKGANMHGPDEHVETASVERLARAFCRLVDGQKTDR